MNMDRSQKNLERKKDDRTIEYLELKYDTNIQRGAYAGKSEAEAAWEEEF